MESQPEALERLEADDAAIRALIAQLPASALTTRGIGGGDWAPRDLIGHLTSWEEHALRSLAEWRSGLPWSLGRLLDDPGVDGLNEASVASKAALDLDTVLENSLATHRTLVRELAAMTEGEWTRSLEGASETWGSQLGSILGGPDGSFAHGSAHVFDLAAFVRDHR